MKPFSRATTRTLQIGAMMLSATVLAACGGGGTSPLGTVSGTAAVGAAMANASIQLTCKNGAGSATANASGAYSASFQFDGPCAITASNGAATIHSFASGAGTYNVTPLTQLLLSYLAGQLGTTVDGLLSGIASNASYQSALTNPSVIQNAEAGVAQLIKKMYGVTLSTSSFLMVSFTPGQSGADSDLDTLLTVGAISSNGQPSTSLAAAAVSAGEASPISGSGNTGPTGGTGGTGGAGTTTK
ncbi:carboxypeptidase regulatory-like domain-containing protein [Paraburkholderia sp. Cy-641]|uniref:carboxypeptidase regulatory-like domain-containing protein n=1 Tax=Paraburkholderia sp. Cy-641 TaxID=2608337 RepID=UPI0014230232|nr:carboxypeptidase regulatory-like domain-containing protein [Paraburkholderia sp. Cy-641]NIF80948.1 carboxypeptidase regulatory-like domain-containing protein [Paraburkholderia sp. Cy-641]